MFKLVFILTFSLGVVICMHAQVPAPTGTPKHDEDVVKISTHLIQIDVTVTDKHGKIVHDLKPEDFELYENGQKQNISNFSFVSNVRETDSDGEKPADKKAQVVLPPGPVHPEKVHRTIALVVDDLSLSFESTYYARRALKKFVDEQMQDGDLVAIIRTGAGIGALQQFTTDKRQLNAAIDRIRWNPIGTGNVGAFAPMEAKIDAGPTPNPITLEDLKKDQDQFRASFFATGTLGAINYVVNGMQDLPGRKSIMLISEGFKLYEEDSQTHLREYGRVLDALHRLADAANRASVVIYTMDARGLVYTGLTASDNTTGRTTDEVESELTDRRNQLFDTQDGLIYLAQVTGGLAIKNTNDLSGGIRRILDDQSYYLLGYVPDRETFDPKSARFNKLTVKVRQPGLNVRYRSGFFGTSEQDRSAVATGPTGRNKLFAAVASPFGASQIPIRLNALFNVAPDGTSYVESLLHIDLKQIKFQDTPEKTKRANIDILVIAFGDNGMVVDQSGKNYTLEFPADVYEKYLREGIVNNFTFPVKKPGAYQLRVAIRDIATDNVGSSNQFIQVPDLKKDRLVLSGIVVENLSIHEWQQRNTSGGGPSATNTAYNDTSNRQFRTGTVLNYAYTALNVRPGSNEGGDLETQVRLFRDGKAIFEGKPQKAFAANHKQRPNAVDLAGSLMLGTEMTAGDYVMQITVTDKLAKEKYNSASQFVQFEIVP